MAYSDRLRRANAQLRKFLYGNLYYHKAVSGPQPTGLQHDRGGSLRPTWRSRNGLGAPPRSGIESEGIHRTVCDYVSGMTDRYLIEESEELGLA